MKKPIRTRNLCHMSERIIYDGSDLVIAMQGKLDELERAHDDLTRTGISLALAEQEYKEVLSKATMRLKTEGMSATMIEQVIYGMKSVSEKRYQRDVADVIYKATDERINITKLEIRILEAQIEREFGRYAGGRI